MTSEFMTSKKFRYLCFTVFGMSVLVALFFELALFFFVVYPWHPGDIRPPLWAYVAAAITLFLSNTIFLSGLIVSRYLKNDTYNKWMCAFFIVSGFIYSIFLLLFNYVMSPKIDLRIAIYFAFSLAVLIYLIRLFDLTGIWPRLSRRHFGVSDNLPGRR